MASVPSAVESWIADRLPRMDPARFAGVKHRSPPDSCARAATFSYFAVPLASGTGSAVLAAPREAPADRKTDGKGALVILLHGLGDDATYPLWHWMETLNRRGFAVLSVDWDGHGANGDSHLDFQIATRSLPLILQRLYGEPGQATLELARTTGPDCYLMGHSTGGAMALIAVTRADVARIVKGVVAVSPAVQVAGVRRASFELMSYASPRAWFRDLFSKIAFYGLTGLVPAFLGFKRAAFPIRLRVGVPYHEQLRAFVRETFDRRRVLREVKVPVLWLHGGKDKVVPLKGTERLMSEIPSQLFCHVDPSRGHLLMAFSSAIPAYAARFLELCGDESTREP